MNQPTHEYVIDLCGCRGRFDYRGEVVVLYERDEDGWIRCQDCGTVPREITAPVPAEHHVELTIYHELDPQTTRKFIEHMPPMAGEDAACPECEAEGASERGISTETSVEDGERVYRCVGCGKVLASGGRVAE